MLKNLSNYLAPYNIASLMLILALYSIKITATIIIFLIFHFFFNTSMKSPGTDALFHGALDKGSSSSSRLYTI